MRKGIFTKEDPRRPAIIERLKAGATLQDESKALGFSHNGPLRAALREHLGGVVQYNAIMAGRIKGKKKECNPVQAGITRRIGVLVVISREERLRGSSPTGYQAPCTQASKPRRLLGLLNRDQEMKGVAPRGECP